MSNLAPPPAANTPSTRTTWAWWNTYHTLFAVFLGAYVAYILIILGRMTHASDEPIPRSLNAILLTALSLAALLAFVAAGNRHRRDREAQWQGAIIAELERMRAEYRTGVRDEMATQLTKPLSDAAAGIARLNDRLNGRVDDDPTVPLAGQWRTRAAIYASAAVDTFRPPSAEVLLAEVLRHADQRIDDRLADIAALARNSADLGESGKVDGVVPLLPRTRG